MEVHPTYDPVNKVWFTDDHKYEAFSLAELLKKLPKNAVIKDYYPRGFREKVKYRDEPTLSGGVKLHMEKFDQRKKLHKPQRVIMPETRPRPLRLKSGHFNRKYNREAILNLWAKGMSAPDIARKLHMERWLAVGSIVSEARKMGDPRAVSRAPASWKYRGREIKRI